MQTCDQILMTDNIGKAVRTIGLMYKSFKTKTFTSCVYLSVKYIGNSIDFVLFTFARMTQLKSLVTIFLVYILN